MVLKLIARDGKEYYGNFGSYLKEATIENIDADLDSQRRVLESVEKLFKKHQAECIRLENIRIFIIKTKYAKRGKAE